MQRSLGREGKNISHLTPIKKSNEFLLVGDPKMFTIGVILSHIYDVGGNNFITYNFIYQYPNNSDHALTVRSD